MEFYDFFEKLVGYIPDGAKTVKSFCTAALPWLYAVFTGATCFAGNYMRIFWNVCLFFCGGFFFPLLVLYAIFKPGDFVLWIFVAISALCGGACVYFSKYLYKTKIFVTAFFIVYISVSDWLIGSVGTAGAVFVGLALALAAGILGIKYKYITVICITAVSGSMMFWNMIENTFKISHYATLCFTILMGVGGIAVQAAVQKEDLKKSYENIKASAKKAKKFGKKIKSKTACAKSADDGSAVICDEKNERRL